MLLGKWLHRLVLRRRYRDVPFSQLETYDSMSGEKKLVVSDVVRTLRMCREQSHSALVMANATVGVNIGRAMILFTLAASFESSIPYWKITLHRMFVEAAAQAKQASNV